MLSVPGALRLYASALVSRLPQGMSPLAVLLLVRGATDSYTAAGLAVGCRRSRLPGAPRFSVGWSTTSAGDACWRRWPARQAALYGVLVVAAIAHAGALMLILVAALAGALLPPIAPVVRVLVREVFDDAGTRGTAYALEAVLQELIWIAGPLLVALVVAFASAEVAVALLGVVCVTGTSVFLRSRLTRGSPADRDRRERRSALASPELRSAARAGGAHRDWAWRDRGRAALTCAPRRLAPPPLVCCWRCGAWAAWPAGSGTARAPGGHRSLLAIARCFCSPWSARHR